MPPERQPRGRSGACILPSARWHKQGRRELPWQRVCWMSRSDLCCANQRGSTSMAMLIEGSCRCEAVRYSVRSHTPYPYQLCYCTICRKTAGGGGFAINIMGDVRTLKAKGRRAIGIYRATISDDDGNCVVSTGE